MDKSKQVTFCVAVGAMAIAALLLTCPALQKKTGTLRGLSGLANPNLLSPWRKR